MICTIESRDFEVEQTAGGWRACEVGFAWHEAHSIAFALIKAGSGRTSSRGQAPERFGREAHAQEKQILAECRKGRS